MRRSDQRRDAVFALYQRRVTDRPLDELLAGAKPFTRELAEGADAHADALDEEIGRLSRGWSLERIAPLELSIMRVALFEMLHRDDVPAEVAIDEAVEPGPGVLRRRRAGLRQRDPGRGRARGRSVDVTDLRGDDRRLNEIADELRGEDLSDERAEELAREAAELVGEAGNEIERALRDAAGEE